MIVEQYPVMTYAEAERLHPDEWVLLVEVKHHSDYRKAKGHFIAHSPDRDDLDNPRMRARALEPHAVFTEFYTGELVPSNVAIGHMVVVSPEF